MNNTTEIQEKKKYYAGKILSLARDTVIVNMRFMDVALSRITPVLKKGTIYPQCDGKNLYYDSDVILRRYKREPAYGVRLLLHVMLHWIFQHAFHYEAVNQEMWNLATDIAVENIILEMDIKAAAFSDDALRLEKLKVLRKNAGKLTAEKLYRNFLVNPLSEDGKEELIRLFKRDDHSIFAKPEVIEISKEEWQKLSERIKADIKTFSKEKNHSESLKENLEEVTREKYNYSDILKRFTVMGEDLTVNDDEFDYIYYTYGLSHYGNMPLVEPLEYKEVKKVKEFAIVLDTSASCQGSIIRNFLKKTYSILKGTENFFSKINIHIIQCDNEIQSDTKVTDQKEFDEFLVNGKLAGFGGTDFRPAFSYLDSLIESGEFENFKGLIYFTDGYGIYPEKMPDYDSMFVFLDEDERRMQVPPWAIKVVLEMEDIMKTEGETE